MGVEKLNYTPTSLPGGQSYISSNIKKGSYVRVRVIKQLGKNQYWIEVKGKTYTAVLKGTLLSSLFIAKVLKNSPGLELKYVQGLIDKNNSQYIHLERLLYNKKSTISKSITTDNFCINKGVLLSDENRKIKYEVRKAIKSFNTLHFMGEDVQTSYELKEYLTLQSLYNIYHFCSYMFLLPFIMGKKVYIGDIRQIRRPEEGGLSFSLVINMENYIKIGFLVYMDYEIIKCTAATNDQAWADKIKRGLNILEKKLESLGYDRKIKVDLIQDINFSESYFEKIHNLKKIDIKM